MLLKKHKKVGFIFLIAVLLMLQQELTGKAAEVITLTAENSSHTFGYEEGIQQFRVTRSGIYRMDVWGAQGGKGYDWDGTERYGGQGGYSTGEIELEAGEILYIGVGGKGGDGVARWQGAAPVPEGYYYAAGGYNGGASNNGNNKLLHMGMGGGGGATHIALKVNKGLLSGYKTGEEREKILLVAGGGSGAACENGYDGGGVTGGGPTTWKHEDACQHSGCIWDRISSNTINGGGGTQDGGGYPGCEDDRNETDGNDDDGTLEHGFYGSFGAGASATTGFSSGAGGGWYGGGSGGGSDSRAVGGAGSGYVKSTLAHAATTQGGNYGNGKAVITLVKLTKIAGGGGSNYVNTDFCTAYDSKIGLQKGKGGFSIRSVNIGFWDTMELKGVSAPDVDAPGKIPTEEGNVTIEPVADSSGNMIRIHWSKPQDYGTTYYHRADSHLALTGTRLCTSNLTKNTLTTGVLGYYYGIDSEEQTIINAQNGLFTGREKAYAYVTLKSTAQYLHVAAVDVAGNVGATSHIFIGSKQYLEAPWPIVTDKMEIAEAENVYRAENLTDTWYVRADDKTPFQLDFNAYIEGAATSVYQINQTIFESQHQEGGVAWNIIETPNQELSEESIETEACGLSFASAGEPMLQHYPYARTVRSNLNRDMAVTSRFTIGNETHGKMMLMIPRAAVMNEIYEVYSSEEKDMLNSIRIIGDSEAPLLYGTEMFEDIPLLNRKERNVILELAAEDKVSGVGEFKVTIFNEDNVMEKTYYGDASHKISIDITEEKALFSGDFTVTITAIDHVGNLREEIHHVTEFALETKIERILPPHDPVFKCGEGGILTIDTWGYVERLEITFPEELSSLAPELDSTIVYDIPKYKQVEKIKFMIPLYAKSGEGYEVKVKAYKDKGCLEDNPVVKIIEVRGTILDELRTRLR